MQIFVSEFERQDIEECQTLKSCVLIDDIEKDLHGLQSYQETHIYISDAIPELKPFLETKVVPVTGDWPTWYFHKKMVCHSNPVTHIGSRTWSVPHLPQWNRRCYQTISSHFQ